MIHTWCDGLNGFKKHTFDINPETKKHDYSIEILNTDIIQFSDRQEIFRESLQAKQTKFVEVLYSGGLDSEFILHSCLVNNIPTRAITLRLTVNGIPFNTHDLYYSEKFCRGHNISHTLVDLDVKKFFENGDHLTYLEPYLITMPHVATHFWLAEQSCGFPIFGGDYPWPWVQEEPIIFSPIRHEYGQYDRFFKDKGISGIGNGLSNSIESMICLLKEHISCMKKDIVGEFGGEADKIAKLKLTIYSNLGLKNSEVRWRSYGWENTRSTSNGFNLDYFRYDLLKRFGETHEKIIWNKNIADILNTVSGSNDRFT